MCSEEEQNEIEAVFMASWDEAENFFNRAPPKPDFAHWKERLTLIRLLRERGYDRQLFLGHSGVDFMLLRAQTPAVRRDQPRIVFDGIEWTGVGAQLVAENVHVFIQIDRLEVTPELENLLIALMTYPLDHGEDWD